MEITRILLSGREVLGFAVFFDGLDGRIARMTNTTSDFGRELDSLADVVTFGIAPGRPLFSLGRISVLAPGDFQTTESSFTYAGRLVAFFFLLCGAVRWRASTCKQIPTPKIPSAPIINILWACRFPPVPALWQRPFIWYG